MQVMKMKKTTTLLAFMLCAAFAWAQSAATEKTGILLVHYGTANDRSRAATIDRLDSMVANRFAHCPVVEAYAAPTVIKTLGKRGIRKLTIAQALDSLHSLGCTRLAVQSTMLLDGVMNDILKKNVERVKGKFGTIAMGRPLLYTVDDCRTLTDMIARNLASSSASPTGNTQVVLVGHGSDSPANAMYSQIDYLLKDEGKPLWHVGTIEGYPTIEAVERQLVKSTCKRVTLVPLLYIAGNHQKEDIDGVWKSALQKLGYKVEVVQKGLGEMPEIQEMILDKVKQLIEQDNN